MRAQNTHAVGAELAAVLPNDWYRVVQEIFFCD